MCTAGLVYIGEVHVPERGGWGYGRVVGMYLLQGTGFALLSWLRLS